MNYLIGCTIYLERKVEEILFEYRGKLPWTEEEFMRRAFEDYFAYVYNMNKDAIKEMISKLICNDLLSSVFSGNHHKLIFSCF